MRINTLRHLKSAGTPIINAWLSIGSGYAAESVARQGFDAATVDCQHGMIGFDTAVTMLQAISSTTAIPMVRPSRLCPAEIGRFLDAGSYGIICPMISNEDDAKSLVSACRYPPSGRRSFGPCRGLLYGGSDYADHADREVLVLAMIETAEAIANLDKILAVDGLDGVYVGPNDLALTMGRTPRNESDDPQIVAAIEQVRAKAASRELIAGIFCSDGPAASVRVAQGFHLVTPGNDAALLREAVGKAARAARGQ